MNNLNAYLPFLIPLAVVEIALAVAALIHVLTHKKYKIGNRIVWVLVVLLINTIGPVLYFAIGRSED